MDQFPDFVDVLKLITEQNEKEKLNMTPDQVKTVGKFDFFCDFPFQNGKVINFDL